MFSFRSQFKRSRRNYPISKKTVINDILSALFQNNEQGLVYHIGDFDRYMSELGPNIAPGGGTFDSATGWSLGAAQITSGQLVFGGINQTVTYDLGMIPGRWYEIQFDLTSRTAGIVHGLGGSFVNIVGRHKYIVLATGSVGGFNATDSFNGSIDNWSVRELTAIKTATLFQDAAGTIPVTSVEQPVGLILDKSKGLVLGPNIVPGGGTFDSTTGYTLADGWSISGGKLIGSNAANSAVLHSVLTPGVTYEVSFDYSVTTGVELRIGGYSNTAIFIVSTPSGSTGTATFLFKAPTTNLFIEANALRFTGTLDNLSIRELPGNHASQVTTTARGVLRARYNLLTYSEDFSNAVWIKNAGISATGANKLVPTTANSIHKTMNALATSLNNVTGNFEIRIRAKADGYGIIVAWFDNASVGARFNVANGTIVSSTGVASGTTPTITSVGNGYYDCSVTLSATNGTFAIYIIDNANNISFAGDGVSGVLIDRIDVRQVGHSVALPTYQYIAAATDYDTAGFPCYIDIDGVDDNYVTSSINFTATDKMTIWAGLRKVDDTGRIFCELSANIHDNAMSFYVVTGRDSSSLYSTIARGTLSPNGGQVAKFNPELYPAQDSAVITAQHDIAGDLSRIRRNSSSVGAIDGTGDKGTGNFGNYPLYLFSRAGNSLRWKGQFYGLIIRGAATDTVQLEQTEQWINSKMGGVY